MTVINSIEVFPSVLRHRKFDVSWRAGSDEYQIGDILFSVEWGERESGPWEKVFGPEAGALCVDGVGISTMASSPAGFVRVVAMSPTGQVLCRSSAFTYGPTMSKRELLEYRDHLRRENLSLEKFTGVQTIIHQRSSLGCPCRECSDEILGGAPDSHCPNCYGTGVEEGYLPPIRMMVDWSAEARGSGNRSNAKEGIVEEEKRTTRLMPFPSLSSKDLMVQDGGGTVWEVVSVQPVTWKIWNVARRASIKMLPKGDPAYKLVERGAR